MSHLQGINKKPIVVAVSGYFNPLHVGHIEMIRLARRLGDKLIVIVNNDQQVKLKGSIPFMSEKDRVIIIKALRDVDEVFLSIDQAESVCKSLAKIKPNIFANGGDRHNVNDIPEYAVCRKLRIKMVDGVGRKIRASSLILAKVPRHRLPNSKPNHQTSQSIQ